MTQKLIMCKGLPASGKSTFAREYTKNNPNSIRINNDDWRSSFWSRSFRKEDEDLVTQLRHLVVRDAVINWYTVIVDNTNLNPKHEASLREIAEAFKIPFEIKEFAVDVQTCIERDKLRGADSVGEKVIRDMAKQWMYYPEPPREFEKVVQSFGANAFIFDIDWTLAYMTDRSPYDYSKVSTDWCYDDVADMAHILKMNGNKIIICSWRKDDCREETIKWLDDMWIEYDLLLMRKSGDNRKDSIVKYELLVNEIIPHYYIQWVFDDRDQVVKMWREAGLRCYQVNYGNF